jgi:hypothetical protein
MAALDAEMEVRSDEESDAGSMVEFICEDSEEESAGESEEAAPPLVSSFVIASGVRRSTRSSAAPQRYMDPHYLDLMTEDASIADVLADSVGSSASDSAYDSESSSSSSESESESE